MLGYKGSAVHPCIERTSPEVPVFLPSIKRTYTLHLGIFVTENWRKADNFHCCIIKLWYKQRNNSHRWTVNHQQLQKRSLEKFRLRRDSNPCLQDSSWPLLPTELRNHTLGARQIWDVFESRPSLNFFSGFFFFNCLICSPLMKIISLLDFHPLVK